MVQSLFSARKFWLLAICLSFTFSFSLLGNPLTTHAQEAPPPTTPTAAIPDPSDGNPATASDAIGSFTNSAQKAADGLANIALDTTLKIPAVASEFIVQLLSFGLWLSGVFFNFIVDETIVKAAQGALGSNSSHPLRPGIETAWKLIRDLINISFIFILLYQSIRMILGRTQEAGKTIVRVAAVALLINFSIFITQVVVDASNIVAIGFYDAFTTVPDASAQNAGDTIAERGYAGGISNAYMNALGLPSIWGGIVKSLATLLAGGATTMLVINILIGLFLIVTMFVFVAAGIMLLVRYIMIIFLVILSPVAFAGLILPGTQQYSKQWWETLTGQAIFAPVFMIMTWINLTLVGSLYANQEHPSLGDFFQTLADGTAFQIGTASQTGVDSLVAVFNFTLIIGTAIASLIIAKRFANQGGKGFGTLTNYIGGAALGGAAWAGRNTVGRYAQGLSQNAAFREKMGKSVFGNLGLKMVDKTASGSFDTRKAPFGGTIFEGMGKAGGEGGYRKSFEDDVKKRQEFAEKYASASKDTTDAYEKAKNDVRKARRVYENTKTPEDRMVAREKLQEAKRASKKAKAKYDREIRQSKTQYAQTMSTADILRPYVGFAPSAEALEAADRVMDNLDGSEKDAEKKQDVADRRDLITQSREKRDKPGTSDSEKTALNANIVNLIEGMGPKDLAEMGAANLADPAVLPHINKRHLDAIKRSDMSAADTKKIIESLNESMRTGKKVHSSIEKLASSPNGAEWGLVPPSSTKKGADNPRIVLTDKRGHPLT